MRSLQERHEDRARRKVDYLKTLAPNEQQNAIETPLAGIGTLNPLHPVSNLSGNGGFEGGGFADHLADLADAGPAAANMEGVNVAPADAMQVAGASGWGAPSPAETADETVGEDGKPLTKAQLAKLLDERKVAYESDANLERLQTLVRENPAKA